VGAGFAISLTLSLLVVGHPEWLGFQTRSVLTFLPAFLIGMLCFVLWKRGADLPQRQAIARAAIASGALILVLRMYVWRSYGCSPWCALDATAYSLLLVGLGFSDFDWIRSRVLNFYGRISYSVYLWHTVVIWWLGAYLHSIYAMHLPTGLKYAECF